MSAVSDGGFKTAEGIRLKGIRDAMLVRQAGAVAAAIADATAVIDNWRKQRDISDRMLKLSEAQSNYVANTFWPRELQFLREFGTPEEVETAEVYGRRFAGHYMVPVAKAFAQAIHKLKCNASRYCTSQYKLAMQSYYQAQATAMTNAKIMGYIQGFNYAQAKNDLNDQRRQQAVSIGKGLFGEAANLYGNAVSNLSSASTEAMTGFSNALEAFGYARQATVDSVPDISSYVKQDATVYGSEQGWNAIADVAAQVQEDRQRAVDSSFKRDYVDWLGPEYNSLSDIQRERWNDGSVGNIDLVRTGSKTYNFNVHGHPASVTVNMSDFKLGWADAFHTEDKGDASP